MFKLTEILIYFLLLCNIIFNESYYLKKNIRIKKQNLFTNDIILHNNINIFGFENNIDDSKFFFIIGEKNYELLNLINLLEKNKYFGLFIETINYSKKDLLDFRKIYMNNNSNIKLPYKNNFWIFNKTDYVGGLFEIYLLLNSFE